MTTRWIPSSIACLWLILGASVGWTDIQLRVWPDKLVYDPTEPCTIQIHLRNLGAEARRLRVAAQVEYELSACAPLPEQEVVVEPGSPRP